MRQRPQITPQLWRWAIGWSIVLLLLSCLPYLIALWLEPPGWRFAGIIVNPFDGHSYLAKMRQGFEGDWLFHLTYTPEPHRGTFIFTFYLALGHLAALSGLPLIWIFHLARLAAGFFLLLVAFRFIALVTAHPTERRLAFILLLTASGFGWLGAIFGAFPIDLWVPEAFVPYSILANPHFPLAMALMLVIFQAVGWPGGSDVEEDGIIRPHSIKDEEASETDKASIQSSNLRQRSGQGSNFRLPITLLSGSTGLALALILPFALLTVWAILALYLIWLYAAYRRLPWTQIWPTLGVGLFSAPIIIYDYWVSITHPILAGWSAQNITVAPAVLDFWLGYGLVGLLAIGGGWWIVRSRPNNRQPGEWLVLLWAVTTIVLVYLPFELQRRLINGLHIPLSILAAMGLVRWLDHSPFKLRHRRLITQTVIAISALGTLFVWSIPVIGLLQPPGRSETTALFFLRQEEMTALKWLRENSSSNDVVLASPRLGTFVPGQTGARAFYGHPFETIEAGSKKSMVEAFYRGELEVISPAVDYIIYGPSEQALGRPANLSDYSVAFSTGEMSIYKVEPQ